MEPGDLCHAPGLAALPGERHEAALGVHLANAHGGGDLRDYPCGIGLAQLLHYGRELPAMDQVIGAMAIIVIIGLLADRMLLALGAASASALGNEHPVDEIGCTVGGILVAELAQGLAPLSTSRSAA